MNQSIQHVFVAVLVTALAGCSKSDPAIGNGASVEADVGTSGGAISMEQGWSTEVRDKLRFTSFGSRLMPYSWFLHLEQADSNRPFRDPEHLQSFGMLSASSSSMNPDGLPIGVTQDVDGDGVRWAGLGCAACHTGELLIDGQAVRVDGGQGMLDFQTFESSVIASLSATIADAEKFSRFAKAVNDPSADALTLKNKLVARAEHLRNLQQTNRSPVPYGPGRLDAFGQIFNAVGVQFLNDSSNRHVPDGPVSYPVLWSAPHLDLVQWNGSAPNAGPGPLLQNVTTALAVYGTIELDGHSGKLGYPSSVRFENLGRIQDSLYQLKSPMWPSRWVQEPDSERAARGEVLYQSNCLSCHALSDRNDPNRKIKVALTSIKEIGTDPKTAQNFLQAMSNSGRYEGQKLAMFVGPKIESRSPSIDLVMHTAIGATLRHPLKATHAAVQGYHKVYKAQIDQHPDYYKARSLDGIWASAPYLHNGSVPTLMDLLSSREERPVTFPVSRHFDAVRVGVDVSKEGIAQFDTRLSGNSNSGHEYGTRLSPEQKSDLLEYLKTL